MKIEKNKKIDLVTISLYTLFFLAVIFLIYFSFFKILKQDEGVFLTIAQGITEDKVPYKDFFDHKPPGIYFILAPLIQIFGNNVFVMRLFLLMVNFISAFFVYKIAEKTKKKTGFWATLFFLLGLIFFEGNYIITEPFMILFLLIGTYFIIKHFEKESNEYLLISGLFFGTACLFKQTAAINLMAIGLIVFWRKKIFKDITIFLYGAFIPLLLSLSYIAFTNTFSYALNQIIILNFTNYPPEPFSKVLLSFAKFALATWPIWLSFIGYFFVRDKKDIKDSIIILFTIAPIPTFLIRHYPHYWIHIVPFVAIAGAIFLLEFFKKIPKQKTTPTISVILVSFLVSLTWIGIKTTNFNFLRIKEESQAKKYINNLDGDTILAENQFTSFYFLTNKKPINKYLYITEITNSKNSERKTINDLETNSDIFVLWPKDPNFAYAKELQDYIFNNYKSIKTYPELGMVIYKRI